jgi:hypothetical protein
MAMSLLEAVLIEMYGCPDFHRLLYQYDKINEATQVSQLASAEVQKGGWTRATVHNVASTLRKILALTRITPRF